MSRSFQRVEDVIENEDFQAWFTGKHVAGWEEWLTANPSQAELVNEAVAFMKDIRMQEAPISAQEIARAYSRLEDRIGEDEQRGRVVSMSRNRFKRWIGVAAALVLLAAVFSIWKYVSRDPSVSTKYGQIASHQLPDGSTMVLNANSCATLSKDWKEGKDREIWLNGEAFFHVKKTVKKDRFVVHTNDLDVIVTGTQFNVWTRDNKTSVLLTEGSVTIRTATGEEIKMVPGEFVQIDHKSLEKKTANEERILAWKDNRILFDSTPIREAARIIQEHYGIKVTVDDSVPDANTLGGMMPNNNLDVLLRSIEATNDYRISRKDGEILISKP
ncbi:FecR domain-containing protein [Terrimonas sp. NA20]|uniref:FecR domain-containing protein n=1 Tax=Terrimonas ginsenosidimutans TaxID=2908004 RepID=A0ABS9KXK1_9BACT|nr:FecR domain-containing protein [Terrimonas ginsenosidimutans]MCG2617045.1 FecR domain-containing protein [Terrimonas ginsenosidimutans]